MSIPAKNMHLAALNHHLRAVPIVFDFVNPVLPLWRLIDRGSKLWLDESEPRVYKRHGHWTLPSKIDSKARSLSQGGSYPHKRKKPGRGEGAGLVLCIVRTLGCADAIQTLLQHCSSAKSVPVHHNGKKPWVRLELGENGSVIQRMGRCPAAPFTVP